MKKKIKKAKPKAKKKIVFKLKTKTKPKQKTKPKKVVKKVSVKTKAVKKISVPKAIGRVTHFFGHIKVAIVKFKVPVKVGAEIHFKGATTDFKEVIISMQFNHESIKIAKKGKVIGIKIKKKVREGDEVFQVK